MAANWEFEFKFPPGMHVSRGEAKSQCCLVELLDWINSKGAIPAKSNPKPTLVRVKADESWMGGARTAVESTLNRLVDEFLDNPYLHRVEHSIHMRLYEALLDGTEFGRPCHIGDSAYRTTLLHKEWPETIPRPDKKGRGNFDLAILAPNQLQEATLPQFVGGHIAAAIVIEVGLNYGFSHLDDDRKKLLNSEVEAGYLLDLRRIGTPDESSIALARKPSASIKTALGHYMRASQSIREYV